ncbi:MAG: pseudaminic acid synthase [Paludibacteraceae bacterium]|nr:pseudaminic acid synthase [Paludibacteraceae bacterium]MBQ6724248.1 pseudaminic acid synthase [Paludibacteraceae bacterium]
MGKCMIVAEMSANHGGDKSVAIETIKAAKRAGADAIKLQTYTADTITLDCDKPDFVINENSIWDGRKFYELYQKAYTPWEWHEELFKVAHDEGLVCFSSPFDKTAIDFLESLDAPMYKIASFEITDIPLIEYAASKMKPMIIATGIAEIEDIQLAVDACRRVGNNDITLLKCTSAYPAPVEEANVIMIRDLAERFGVKAGLSDHTIGAMVPVLAAANGAVMIEKHFILNKEVESEDATFSMDETEFRDMVQKVRLAEAAMGKVDYSLTEKMKNSRTASRSLYVAEDMKAGDMITEQNVRSVRPGFGLHPKYLPEILGKRVNRDLKFGDRMELEYVNF